MNEYTKKDAWNPSVTPERCKILNISSELRIYDKSVDELYKMLDKYSSPTLKDFIPGHKKKQELTVIAITEHLNFLEKTALKLA